MYAENLEAYLEQMAKEMVQTASPEEESQEKKEPDQRKRIVVVDEEAMKKVYSYIELNFGKSYLSQLEEKRRTLWAERQG